MYILTKNKGDLKGNLFKPLIHTYNKGDLMKDKHRCNSCGEKIEKDIIENYKETSLEGELYLCRGCIKEVAPESLFKKIKGNLNEKNKKKWQETDISMKAAFSLKMIKKGSIQGGTPGDVEYLRAVAASNI